MATKVLAAQGLSKRFKSGDSAVSVLKDLSLSLASGASLALTGRSGSGKSTLLNLLCGLETPDSGSIRILDQTFERSDLQTQNNASRRWCELRRHKLGVVFQEANLMPALSLRDNVRLRAQLADQSADRAGLWLARLGLEDQQHRYPDQVSGGQRQRAALAMVFAMNPALILADEPTGSLDRRTADSVIDTLFQWQSEQDCALILATHDEELAARCGQRLDLGHADACSPAHFY